LRPLTPSVYPGITQESARWAACVEPVGTTSPMRRPLLLSYSEELPRWESEHGSISEIPVQCPCAGRRAEIAVDQIRTVSKERLGRRLDRLARPLAAQLRQLITEMYGESR